MRHPSPDPGGAHSGRLTHGRGTFLPGGPTPSFSCVSSQGGIQHWMLSHSQLHGTLKGFVSGFRFRFVPFRSLALAGVVGYLRLLGSVSGLLGPCLRFEYRVPLAPPQHGLDPWNFDAFLSKGFPRLLGRLGTVVIDRSVSDGRLLPSRGWPIGVCANTRRCVPWQLASQDQRRPLLFASSFLKSTR